MRPLIPLIASLFVCVSGTTWSTGGGSRHHYGRVLPFVRGGGSDEDDEQRYSRQIYTLGQRAHGLIRSSTIYLDGPLSSGLLYECAKNLALSGVGNVVILADDTEDDVNIQDRLYHNAAYDDLGRAYQRAARTELDVTDSVDGGTLLQMYLQKLNPSVHVSLRREKRYSQPLLSDSVLIAVDRPHATQVRLNTFCRQTGTKFVSIETAGVYGKAFCDFGPDFQVYDADGETPLEVPLQRLEIVDDQIRVHCVEGEKHDVSAGDMIEFRMETGELVPDCTCKVLRVEGPTKFLVGASDTQSIQETCNTLDRSATTFRRVKIPTAMEFSPLESIGQEAYSSDSSLFAICDLDKCFDAKRRGAILSSFEVLGDFVEQNGGHPTKQVAKTFQAMASDLPHTHDMDDESWQDIVHKFASTCMGKLTPVQGILGAIGAQEALKAASGLYSPIRQFLLYDCEELLNEGTQMGDDTSNSESKGQAYVLGSDVSQTLSKKKIFVVGAGAIGCELLKNLAAMGARQLAVTDMDTIEHSNLSRQLLFRDSDIGSFKSVAAQEGVSRYNPYLEIEVHTSKVGDEENSPFNDMFWDSVDIVLNALDNVDARLYVDSQCVAYQKALVDAGTLGSKGNVQVVVPFQSESYGSSVDPQEQAIPVCTLKTFPYLISHTIQWGRDLFEGYFRRRPSQANDFVGLVLNEDVDLLAQKLLDDMGDDASLEAAEEILEDLHISQDWPDSTARDTAISWAARCADRLFRENIESLLTQHPLDSVDEDGEQFWTGARRAPRPIRFVAGAELDSQQAKVNANLVMFVQSCARLRLETLDPSLKDKGASTISRHEAEASLVGERSFESPERSLTALINKSKVLAASVKRRLNQIEFEKDDDSNGHVEFVSAASNLRAICYGIAPVDEMTTRRIAGQIVPAMITTTGLVASLSCIELLKLIQHAPRERHRNAFINLALPFFAFTQPVPAESTLSVGGKMFTLWDRIMIKEGEKAAAKGGIQMSKVLSRIIKTIGLDEEDSYIVSSISYGPYMIYANYMHDDDRELLKSSFWEVLADALQAADEDEFVSRDGVDASMAGQVQALLHKRFIDLSVVVEHTESGDEVEIPPVRIVRYTATASS